MTTAIGGWHVLLRSDELGAGEVKSLSFSGRELVAFRTAQGQAAVVDAHCPHQGAHLGHGGWVDGETLVCPFHQWAFDTGGRCVAVPFTRPTSFRSQVRSYRVLEQDGQVLISLDLQPVSG